MPAIIFKPSERCNANCIYCDVVQRKASKTMPLNLLELVFKKINEYLEENTYEEMILVWHGGEPCIVGAGYFRKALEYQERYCSKTKNRLVHSIQSNLTLINQQILDVLREMGIKTIGTSYELIPNIRGIGEKRDSATYNRLFMKGIELLLKNGISWGFIYVVTRKALTKPLDIFYFLSNFKLDGHFSIHSVEIYKQCDKNNIGITPLEFANFLGAIFPAWWENKDRFKEIDPFKSYLSNYIKGPHRLLCTDSGICGYSHVYIGPTGNASHCGRSSDWDILPYGNIQNRSLTEIFKDKKRESLIKRNEVLPHTECKGCAYWKICHGGCPLEAFNDRNGNGFMNKTGWCDAKRIFLKKYFEPITGLSADFSNNSNCKIF